MANDGIILSSKEEGCAFVSKSRGLMMSSRSNGLNGSNLFHQTCLMTDNQLQYKYKSIDRTMEYFGILVALCHEILRVAKTLCYGKKNLVSAEITRATHQRV
jgi:hypothetical protein